MRRAMAGVGVLAAGLVGLGAITTGATGDSTLPAEPSSLVPKTGAIGTVAEAWYDLPFSCDLPLGCLPVPNILPAGTLHVGVLAGLTTSVTALKLDTASLPKGASIIDGTLKLPIDPSAASLSLSPEKAGFKACLLTQEFTAGEGLTVAPPTSDCSISNPASYVTDGGAHFEIDLQPFIDAWKSGAANNGISLEPFATAKSDHASWQVALVSTTSATDAASKILASLHFTAPAAAGTDAGGSPAPAVSEPVDTPSAEPAGESTTPVTTVAQPQQAPVVAPATLPKSTSAGLAGKGYAYPAVWLLPIALLAGCAWVGRLLTKPIGATR